MSRRVLYHMDIRWTLERPAELDADAMLRVASLGTRTSFFGMRCEDLGDVV